MRYVFESNWKRHKEDDEILPYPQGKMQTFPTYANVKYEFTRDAKNKKKVKITLNEQLLGEDDIDDLIKFLQAAKKRIKTVRDPFAYLLDPVNV